VKYFVTGGAGFIGSNYVEMLLESTPDVSAVTIFDAFTYASNPKNYSRFINDKRLNVIRGNICDFNELSKAMIGHDFVINFAAETHVDRSILGPEVFVHTNILGAQNIFEAAKNVGVRTVIQISTDEVYGSISEGSSDELHNLEPNSPYAASKAAADLLARSYFITYGLDIRITRSCNNYGKYQYPEKIIPLFTKNIITGKKIPIYGDGSNLREWINVFDNCVGIQTVLSKGSPGHIYNIGTGVEISNNRLATIILNVLGGASELKSYVENRKGHDFRYSLNFSKILNLGYKTKIGFSEGIKETIIWHKENIDWWDQR
jgi:dTDP-glucose 4,6-dehydratase